MEGKLRIYNANNAFLRLKAHSWWNHSGTPLYNALVCFVIACTCLEIWLARNKARFENRNSHVPSIIGNITNEICIFLNHASGRIKIREFDKKWFNLFSCVASMHTQRNFLIIKWVHPPTRRVKLNCDGCSKGNPGNSGGGAVLCDYGGKLIWAMGDFYGTCSNMYAKTVALLQGLKRCIETGFLHVVIETDS
ncbi:hypothetical protein LguiA_032859 [Lonicera macranthoides]